MMSLQVVFVLVLMAGSSLCFPKKSLDIPNHLQAILGSYKVPKGTFQKEPETRKMEAPDVGQSNPSLVDSLLRLRRDLYHAYNLTYQIRDPIGHILYRKEYGDGAGSLKGSMNFMKDNGSKMTVINYSLKVEEYPSPSPAPVSEQMNQDSLLSAPEGNFIAEEYIQEKLQPSVYVSKAPQEQKSTSMDNKGNVFQKAKSLSLRSFQTYDDDLETLPSQMIEYEEPTQDYLGDDMQGPVTVLHMKPKPRGYEQVWKRGQGLVVDREYELPESYDYRSAFRHRADAEDDENQQPLYVYNTKPIVKVFEVTRDLDGKYRIPENKEIKQRLGDYEEEEPLYITHTKPEEVQIMQMSSDVDDSGAFWDGVQGQYSNDYVELDSEDGASPINNL